MSPFARAVVAVAALTLVVPASAGPLSPPTHDVVADRPEALASSDASFVAVDRAGNPARWGCEAVPVYVDPEAAPVGAAELVEEAVERVRAATALDLRFAGLSLPQALDGSVVVAWRHPRRAAVLSGDELAATDVRWRAERSRLRITRAAVVVSTTRTRSLPLDFGAFGLGPVLMHELGHAVGVGHSDAPSDVMRQGLPHAVEWGAGDLRALEQVAPECVRPADAVKGGDYAPPFVLAR